MNINELDKFLDTRTTDSLERIFRQIKVFPYSISKHLKGYDVAYNMVERKLNESKRQSPPVDAPPDEVCADELAKVNESSHEGGVEGQQTECPTCLGKKHLPRMSIHGEGTWIKCWKCNGTGKVNSQ